MYGQCPCPVYSIHHKWGWVKYNKEFGVIKFGDVIESQSISQLQQSTAISCLVQPQEVIVMHAYIHLSYCMHNRASQLRMLWSGRDQRLAHTCAHNLSLLCPPSPQTTFPIPVRIAKVIKLFEATTFLIEYKRAPGLPVASGKKHKHNFYFLYSCQTPSSVNIEYSYKKSSIMKKAVYVITVYRKFLQRNTRLSSRPDTK